MCIHLALLYICDTRALYAMARSAVMVREWTTIYGSSRVLYVRYVLCGRGPGTVCVVLWFMYMLGRKR
jgi:hypothetical protein